MEPPNDIRVRMCEASIGQSGDVLHAILGSCVGIGLLWRKRGICALAHCLLPEAPPGDTGLAAKYVSSALPALLNQMGASKAQYAEIDAVIAGGACMVSRTTMPRHGQIGEQNAETARRLLAAARIRIVHADLGGDLGRRLRIDCGDYHYDSHTIAGHD